MDKLLDKYFDKLFIMKDGHIFEKAGVGVSVVHGLIPPSAVAQMNARFSLKGLFTDFNSPFLKGLYTYLYSPFLK